MKGYIHSDQLPMFGHKDVIGYGDSVFNVKEIERAIANEIIIKNHYSHKIFNNSYIHLGVFINNELLGVLQFGHLMNNNSVGNIVSGTKNGEATELNRMWLDDKAERNSESKAISYSFKYLKGKFPQIKWVQSFADERCGGLGIVYQACSFSYYGEHLSEFYEFEGEVYHKIMFTNNGRSGSNSAKARHLKKNKDKAKTVRLRQFRYIKYIHTKTKRQCLLKEQPYPKHYNND